MFCRHFKLLIYISINQLAIGCLDPPQSNNVKLVNRTENILKFACAETEHVFPDTASNIKTIACEGEAWNETLTDCVGKFG